MKEWRGDGWWEWWVDGTDGRSATQRTRWVRIGEISAWLMEGSWFQRRGEAYWKERPVIRREDDVDEWLSVTKDEERVLAIMLQKESMTLWYIRWEASRTTRSVDATNVSRIMISERIKHHATPASPTPTQWIQIIAAKRKWISQRVPDTHTHPFNGPLSGTTRVSRYQNGKTNLAFTEARDSKWQWHQLSNMQVCILLQTDNHASTQPLNFFTGWMPFLPPNQQRQSTEGSGSLKTSKI